MKIVMSNILPPKGFKCINLFGVLFCRSIMSNVDINHEKIHTAQMKEMLYIFFYLWYIIEWLIRLLIYWDSWKAYKTISFEQEAYANQSELSYLNNRKHYSWLNY